MAKKRKEENEKKEENFSLGNLGFSHSYAISPAMRVCCMIYIASLQFLFVTFNSLSQISETGSPSKTTFRLFSSCNLSPSVYSNVSPTDSYRNLISLLSRQIHQLGTPVNDFHPQPNITQFDRGQFYYIKEYSYCMPGSNHVYCILGSLKREISLEFESYISQWHCRIQVIWSA